MIYSLDRAFLDDIASASKEKIEGSDLWLTTPLLAPAIEYELLAAQHGSFLPPLRSVCSSPLSAGVARTIRDTESTTNTSSKAQEFEFIRFPSDQNSDLYWKTFRRRFASAATEAGFNAETARGLLGVFLELASNVYLHSERPQSGFGAYRCSSEGFEFVVADTGIGVLASLKQNPEFAELNDHAVALAKTVQENETRFGRGVGHGNGFLTVFRNLAALRGALRFRSGDYTLDIQETSLLAANAKSLQREYLQGFLASIHCAP